MAVIINKCYFYLNGKKSFHFYMNTILPVATSCTGYFILFINTGKKFLNRLFKNSGKTFFGLYLRVLKAIKMPLRIKKAILVHLHAKYNILY